MTLNELLYRNMATRLYNIGRDRLADGLESGTWQGLLFNTKKYIYSRSENAEIMDNSNIRVLANLPLVESDEIGAYIPSDILTRYLTLKEEGAAAEEREELEELESSFDTIEEALETIAENGLADEDDYMEAEEEARKAEAERISGESGIALEKCLEFIHEKAWIEFQDYVEYYEADYQAFLNKASL